MKLEYLVEAIKGRLRSEVRRNEKYLDTFRQDTRVAGEYAGKHSLAKELLGYIAALEEGWIDE